MKWKILLILLSVTLFLGAIIFGLQLTKAAKAGLQVITGDKSASVFINDQYFDHTPLIDKNLKPGNYTLSIRPDDTALASYDTEVTLHPGTITVVTWHAGKTSETSGGVIYEMEKLIHSGQAEINFMSVPDKAIIDVDGKKKDLTPLLIKNIAPGQHQYQITAPSYETQSHTLNLVAGYKINAIIKLAKTVADQSSERKNQLNQRPTPTVRSNQKKSSTTEKKLTILTTHFFQQNQEGLKVRRDHTQSSPVIGFVLSGKKYPYLGEQKGWYQIRFGEKNQNLGWISARYARKNF